MEIDKEYIDPTGRVKKAEIQALATFVDTQVAARSVNAITVLILAQALYFKAKNLSAEPRLSWPERKDIITSLLDFFAKKHLEEIDYQVLQPSLTIIIPDTLESLRDMSRSKGGNFCGFIFGSSRPTKDLMEAEAVRKLEADTQK
jgi:hypothetical protein